MATASDSCPWCGSTITHARFVQIQAAIREEERKKLADFEQTVRARLEKEVAAQQLKLNKQIVAAKQQADQQRKKELAEVRQILQKDRDNALLKKEAEFSRERDALQKKIADMTRRIKKSGGDVAEGAELDLFEELRGAFGEDQIARIKGKASGAILQEVRYKGKSAGRILIDATPRGAWQHAYVTKLRQDQSEIGADHAILATAVFPAGKRELFVDSGVLVIAPARVAAIVDILRRNLIAMQVAKLTTAERTDKLSRLFKFMTSPAFKKKLAEASELAGEALQIDVDEKRAHDLVWKRRGTVLTRIRSVLRDIDADVSTIVESPAEPTPIRAAAFRVTSR